MPWKISGRVGLVEKESGKKKERRQGGMLDR